MEYIITKEQAQKHCVNRVCPCCGWEIEPLKTVDNARNPTYWNGCNRCCLFTSGVEPYVYDLAVELVSTKFYGFYSYNDEKYYEDVKSASEMVAAVFLAKKRLDSDSE